MWLSLTWLEALDMQAIMMVTRHLQAQHVAKEILLAQQPTLKAGACLGFNR